jgi:hypothetical protein
VNISAGIVLMFAWIGAVVGDDSKSHGIAWFCFITFVFAVCVNVFMHFTRRRLRKKAAEIEALYANAE